MKTIQPHSHQDRTKIAQQLIPFLQEKYGDNLIAFASDGSFARGEDTTYSDLELIAFLEKIPEKGIEPIRKIIDGLYIVMIFETKESYIRKYLEITDIWYASGAGKLNAIINEAFVKEVNSFRPANIEKKCLGQIEKRWPFFQEITAKVLNNCLQNEAEAIPLSFPAMVKEVLILLSFLNATPYISLGRYITQARNFQIKPKSFEKLIKTFINGKYQQYKLVEEITEEVFSELEYMIEKKGLKLCEEKLQFFDILLI